MIAIHTSVFREAMDYSEPDPWNAQVQTMGDDETGTLRLVTAESWPEAMQLAYKLKHDLERDLFAYPVSGDALAVVKAGTPWTRKVRRAIASRERAAL